jgi:hypothetical protein
VQLGRFSCSPRRPRSGGAFACDLKMHAILCTAREHQAGKRVE